MADEIRVAPEAPVADEPEVARAEIAMTRARMSETIDDIEDALLRRKEKIQDRMDVFAPVREKPLQAAGAAFGVGLLLGLLTGGDDDDDDYDRAYSLGFESQRGHAVDAERSAELWERRARRLLSIAREQREMARGSRFADDDDWEGSWSDEGDEDDGHGPFANLRDMIAERVGPLIGMVARELLNGNRRS